MKKNLLQVAKIAALSAGKILMHSYGKLKSSQISSKSKNDFVTEIDKKSEACVIKIIKSYYPDHSIQAEESGVHQGALTRWIIDPLDGTSNYIHHFPAFSVSIGVMENGVLTTGVIYDPLHNELFCAQKGKGAYLNNKPILVSSTQKLSTAFMATGIPFRARGRFDEYIRSFEKISMGSAGMRRGGSAALDLAYVAAGRFDGFWEINLSPWDIAAGAVIVQEAGGQISDLWGNGQFLTTGDVLASNRKIHKELKSITSNIFTPKIS